MSYDDRDYDRAEYEAEMASERAARSEPYEGKDCECCGEPMTNPRVFDAPGTLGRDVEQAACSEDCERELRYPPRHVGEDFRADWDPYYREEPEWDDATGRRIH